jgi:hypothetical protein
VHDLRQESYSNWAKTTISAAILVVNRNLRPPRQAFVSKGRAGFLSKQWRENSKCRIKKGGLVESAEILRRLAEKYARCKSYSDSGTVDFLDAKEEHERIQFKTDFLRPDRFRFKWQDYGPKHGKTERFSTLWSNKGNNSMHRVTRVSKFEELPNLRVGIANATGRSAGAAHMVSSLLMTEIQADSRHLLQLESHQLLRYENLNYVNCYVVQGSLLKQNDTKLWIATNDFSLRRAEEEHTLAAEELKRAYEQFKMREERLTLTLGGSLEAEKGAWKDHKYEDKKRVTEYNYETVTFDESIDTDIFNCVTD